jgi:putative membrane protein
MEAFVYGLLAFAHLVGVVLAVPSVLFRALALRRFDVDPNALKAALMADNVWGIAALILLPTGLYRLLVLGKGWSFYANNPYLVVKLGLFGLLFMLELWPMFLLLWQRVVERKGQNIVTSRRARLISRISLLQTALLIGVLFCAPMMARGVGQRADAWRVRTDGAVMATMASPFAP